MKLITVGSWLRIHGEWFFLRTMKRLDWIVLGICVLCLYAVIQIRLGCLWYIGRIENADAVNSIIEGLSYSYVAAYLFYLLTVFIPTQKRRKKLLPMIRERVHDIGIRHIHSILLEFGRGTQLGSDYSETQHSEEILKSKNWDSEVPMFKKYDGISITHFRYAVVECKAIQDRIADIIIRYAEVLTGDEINALEDFSKNQFFSLALSLASHPTMQVNSGVDSLVEAFIKMQKEFLEVEKLFKIEP